MKNHPNQHKISNRATFKLNDTQSYKGQSIDNVPTGLGTMYTHEGNKVKAHHGYFDGGT